MSTAPSVAFRTACAAPFVTLHLDPTGEARACGENRLYRLGNVVETSLSDVWHGDRLATLRAAVRRGELLMGCEGCAAAIATGRRDGARVGLYDAVPVASASPPAPVHLELELSIRCNLQCVMCSGEYSSSIRTHREHRAPLPAVFGDAFFDELARLAPELDHVAFVGGEPFLGAEPLRAFEVLAAAGYDGTCHVTTNGTVVNDRVGRILDALRVDVSISIDGFTAPTVEAIRVGADHAELLRNVEWFIERASRRGTAVTFHYCLLRANHHELAPFLRWADGLGVAVVVIPVRHPITASLDHLDLDELRAVHRGWLAADAPVGRNRAVWEAQLGRVADRLGAAATPEAPPLDAWATHGRGEVTLDANGIITGAGPDPADVVGLDTRALVGAHHQALMAAFAERYGPLQGSELLAAPPGVEDRLMHFGSATVRARLDARAGAAARWELGVTA